VPATALGLADAHAHVWADTSEPAALLHRALFGVCSNVHAFAEPTLSDQIAGVAWDELRAEISAALPAAAPCGRQGKWSGAVRLRIAFAADDSAGSVLPPITLQVDGAVAAAWCEGSPQRLSGQPGRPLTPPAAVVQRRPLRLAAHLAAVEMDLGSLRTLQVGDILTLPHRLGEPMQVRVDADGSPAPALCQGHLLQRDGRKVLELIAGASSLDAGAGGLSP